MKARHKSGKEKKLIIMQLTVKRQYRLSNYTIGKLYINGEYFCDTLEDTDRGLTNDMTLKEITAKKVYGETAIPIGTYNIDLYTKSPRYKAVPYYKQLCDGCVPRIVGVKGFDGILIHVGNTAKDTHGCLLVGQNKAKGQVLNSKATFTELYKRLLPAKKNKEQVVITYTY